MEIRVNLKPINTILQNHGLNEGGRVQKFIDQECIRQMEPYTPFQNSGLVKSATTGTVIGTGIIKQNAPHARFQYYGKLMVSSITGSSYSRGEKKVLTDVDLKYHGGGKRGKKWFDRMKADHKKDILKGAQKLI